MFTLLKNAHVYAPEDLGCQDILLVGRTIAYMAEKIENLPLAGVEILDVEGAAVTPGFIDQHIHITGGGGEGSFKTRVPEIQLSTLTTCGTTTVIGTLGTDGTCRSMENLLAKARGLEEEGISTWIYSGAYPAEGPHIMGNLRSDIVLIDKIIGGKVAMSDHRSSQPHRSQYAKLAAEARIGGMMSGKAGVLHVHIGDGKRMLSPIFKIVAKTEIPITQFRPTHLNRNPETFADAIRFGLAGGYLDLTCQIGIPVAEAVQQAIAAGVPLEQITVSTDGNGSMPRFNEQGELIGLTAASPAALVGEVMGIVRAGILPLSQALRLITSNVADALKLEKKGHLAVGMDADLVVLNKDLAVQTVFAKGQLMVKDGVAVVKGTFE
ncbi:MAG: beta-aspartyl-peptidase [Acidaminococcaceae bacterium]